MLRFSGHFHAVFSPQSGWISPSRVGGYAPFSPGVSYKHRDVFTASEAATIKQTMDDFASLTDDRKLVGKILVYYAQYEGKLTNQEADRSQRQVDDVAIGRYDHIIERAASQGLSR